MKTISLIIRIAMQGFLFASPVFGRTADSNSGRSPPELRKFNALKLVWSEGEAAPAGSPSRRQLREEFLAKSAAYVADHGDNAEVWTLRAKAALELKKPREGWEAGRKLIALGLESSDDPAVQSVLVALERNEWLDERAPALAAAESAGGAHLASGPAAPADLAGRPWTAPGTGISLPWIPAGIFRMGPDENDTGKVQTVHITRGFWLGATLVTQGQWKALIGGNPSYFKDEGEKAPVEQVSWYDAVEFCRRLNERERAANRLPPGYEYRLPTEAEWEYACRAGSAAEAGDPDRVGWYRDNAQGKTHPVAQKAANGWGLYDMHGNLWEWCLDWYGPYAGGDVYDPAGAVAGANRVNRGGSWFSVAPFLRTSLRYFHDPIDASNFCGFRLALAPQVSP